MQGRKECFPWYDFSLKSFGLIRIRAQTESARSAREYGSTAEDRSYNGRSAEWTDDASPPPGTGTHGAAAASPLGGCRNRRRRQSRGLCGVRDVAEEVFRDPPDGDPAAYAQLDRRGGDRPYAATCSTAAEAIDISPPAGCRREIGYITAQ